MCACVSIDCCRPPWCPWVWQLLICACISSSSAWCAWHRSGYACSIVDMCTPICENREHYNSESKNRGCSVSFPPFPKTGNFKISGPRHLRGAPLGKSAPLAAAQPAGRNNIGRVRGLNSGRPKKQQSKLHRRITQRSSSAVDNCVFSSHVKARVPHSDPFGK